MDPNPFVFRTLRGAGLTAEAASECEFRHAQASGFPLREILLGGPGMPESALQAARKVGAKAILLESERALERLISADGFSLMMQQYCLLAFLI